CRSAQTVFRQTLLRTHTVPWFGRPNLLPESSIVGKGARVARVNVPEACRLRGATIPVVDTARFRDEVERFIREHALIPEGGEVVCLVSGGADSTCLWHALTELGYRVSALHVAHGLRGEESEEDARFCREVLGAEVVDGRGGRTEDELRTIRYGFARKQLRATGHTAD